MRTLLPMILLSLSCLFVALPGCAGAPSILPLSPPDSPVRVHDITLSVSPKKGTVSVVDHITLGDDPRQRGSLRVLFPSAPGVKVDFTLDGAPAVLEGLPIKVDDHWESQEILVPRRGKVLTLSYVIRNDGAPHPAFEHHGDTLVLLSGSKGWYPRLLAPPSDSPAAAQGPTGPTLSAYRFTLKAPRNWHAAGPGILIHRETIGSEQVQVFEVDKLLPHLDLAIGAFHLAALPQAGGPSPRAYFLSDSQRLLEGWLHAAERQLAYLDHSLSPPPGDYYTLVEIPDSSDFTLQGGIAIPKSVVEEALPDPFLARVLLTDAFKDALPPKGEGDWRPAAIEYLMSLSPVGSTLPPDPSESREAWLRDWRSIEGPGEALPLSMAISPTPEGIGRGAMVLHQLSIWIGEEAFLGGMTKLAASTDEGAGGWSALQRAMEAEVGGDLSFFFDPWLNKLGAPKLTLLKAEEGRLDLGEDLDSLPVLRIRIGRDGFRAPLKVPVLIDLTGGQIRQIMTLDGPMVDGIIPLRPTTKEEDKALLEILGPLPQAEYHPKGKADGGNAYLGGSWAKEGGMGTLTSVRVDPDFEALRDLWPQELLPRIAEVLGNDTLPVLVIPGGGMEKSTRALANQLKRGTLERAEYRPGDDLGSLIAVAPWEDVMGGWVDVGPLRLPLPRDLNIDGGVVWDGVKPYSTYRTVALVAVPAPWDPSDRVLIVLSPNPKRLGRAFLELGDIGQAGFLLIGDDGRPVAKGRYEPGPNPLLQLMNTPPAPTQGAW